MVDSVVAIIVADSGGTRIAAKYAAVDARLSLKSDSADKGETRVKPIPSICGRNLSTYESQKKLEGEIFTHAYRSTEVLNNDICLVGELPVIFKTNNDVLIYIVGNVTANEMLLMELCNTFEVCLQYIVQQKPIEKKSICENLDSLYLLLDEIMLEGVPLETNPSMILRRIFMQEINVEDINKDSQSLNDAISSAKDSLMRSLLSGASSI